MPNRMQEILTHKLSEVGELRKRGLPTHRGDDLPPLRDFRAAKSTPGRIRLIAEIKFASPSAGVIRKHEDPCAIGLVYEEAGAAAISFLTDSRFFGGSLEELPRLKRTVSLPILRKDFIIDPIQVKESLLYGADAILLIARILSREKLKQLLALSEELGLTPLTEVHDPQDLDKAVDCGAEVIGINNRNLDTFEVHLQTTIDLVPRIPKKRLIVSESGIANPADMQWLRRIGIHAALVGTSIMKSRDMASKLKKLVDAGGSERENGKS
jgi:indole-3-glycerol phosphate synthase